MKIAPKAGKGSSVLTSGLQDLTRPLCAIGKCEVDDFIVSREFNTLENDQRSVDTSDGVVPNARHDGVGRRLARVRHCCR
jgi:hypothetical protein